MNSSWLTTVIFFLISPDSFLFSSFQKWVFSFLEINFQTLSSAREQIGADFEPDILLPSEKRNLRQLEAASQLYENVAFLGDFARRLPHLLIDFWRRTGERHSSSGPCSGHRFFSFCLINLFNQKTARNPLSLSMTCGELAIHQALRRLRCSTCRATFWLRNLTSASRIRIMLTNSNHSRGAHERNA